MSAAKTEVAARAPAEAQESDRLCEALEDVLVQLSKSA